jgi:hypothetical protein
LVQSIFLLEVFKYHFDSLFKFEQKSFGKIDKSWLFIKIIFFIIPYQLTRSSFIGQSLVALLHSTDSAKVARVLVTVANAAAFTRNQVMIYIQGPSVADPGSDVFLTPGSGIRDV